VFEKSLEHKKLEEFVILRKCEILQVMFQQSTCLINHFPWSMFFHKFFDISIFE